MGEGIVGVVLGALARAGVAEVVLCAGARNAEFVQRLGAARGVRTYSFFEERGAGFFAIGRIRATGRPVAVVTTSGTAAAELLPPMVEADHQGLPLVAVTADRPRAQRGSGAPQTINQLNLYTDFVERRWDVADGDPGLGGIEVAWSGRRPIHLNVCLGEPRRARFEDWEWDPGEFRAERPVAAAPEEPILEIDDPLVLVGGLTPREAPGVFDIVEGWGVPVYAEGVSQLRGRFTHGVPDPAAVGAGSIVRVGSVPTHRVWRDLENSVVPVHHFASQPARGLARAGRVRPLEALKLVRTSSASGVPCAVGVPRAPHAAARPGLDRLLDQFPLSEPAWVRWLSRNMSPDANLFLGNSLPIREWDLAAIEGFRGEVNANRGANGIDGLVSTALGAARERGENWAILGDLSTLYDLSGPWAYGARPLDNFNLVVLNNGGGKIFERVIGDPRLENRHALGFGPWAAMWGWGYECPREPDELRSAAGARVIEIIPDSDQTRQFWDLYAESRA